MHFLDVSSASETPSFSPPVESIAACANCRSERGRKRHAKSGFNYKPWCSKGYMDRINAPRRVSMSGEGERVNV